MSGLGQSAVLGVGRLLHEATPLPAYLERLVDELRNEII
jgi:hypothetical protein